MTNDKHHPLQFLQYL